MDTKSFIVQTATKLFYEKGYVSVGLAEIISATKTSKGSFYHHFPKGKEQLLITCLEKLQEDVIEDMQQHFAAHDTFSDSLQAIFERLIGMFEAEGRIAGYTLLSMVSEISVLSETAREVYTNLYKKLEAGFAEQLKKTGIAAEEAQHKAVFLTAMLEGAIMLSVTKHSSEPLRIVAQQVRHYMNIKGDF